MKRFLRAMSFLLGASLLLSMGACTGTTSSDTPGTSLGEESPQANNNISPRGAYDQPVTLSTVKGLHPNPSFPEGSTERQNALLDAIKSELNIDVDVIWQSDDYDNKLALSIASGDIPDMFYLSTDKYLMYKNLLDNGMLADLTPAIEGASGDYLKSITDSLNGKNYEALKKDGKIYGIGSTNLGYGHNVLWLRKDWLDRYQLPLPTSIEEIEMIARTFIEKDAGGKGAGKTLGIVTGETDFITTQYGLQPMFAAHQAYPKQWMQDDAGQVYYGSTTPQTRETLSLLSRWYKEGILDKTFITKTLSNDVDAVIDGGYAGMFFGPWWVVGSRRNELAKSDPEAEWVPVNAPLDANGTFNVIEANAISGMFLVSNKVKNPEAVLKVINLEFDYYRGFDEKGISVLEPYTEANTSMFALFPTGGLNLDFYDVVPRLGKVVKSYVDGKGDESVLENDPLLTNYDKTQARLAYEYAQSRDVNSPGWKAYQSRYVGSNILQNSEVNLVSPAFYYPTQSSQDLKPALDKLEEEMYLKIIVGEEPIEYFDTFVEKWTKMGGDILTAEVQAEVDKK